MDDIKLGVGAYLNNECEQAIELLQPLADLGDAEAAYYTALSYLGLNEDLSNENIAAQYMRKSADLEYCDALTFLCQRYSEGKHFGQSATDAFQRCKRAVNCGKASAMHLTGCMYWNGTGTDENRLEAIAYFKRAIIKGSVGSRIMLGKAYALGGSIEKNDSLSLYWMQQASDMGSEIASDWLNTTGLAQYQQLEKEGSAEAAYQLGRRDLSNTSNPERLKRAQKRMETAADNGHYMAAAYMAALSSDSLAMEKWLSQLLID